jgi:glycosyltransferase involved in cell wall biosynthesis
MRIVGMIPVYNESDIIEQVIRYLISQGIQLVIIDNGSNDGSYETCRKFVGAGVLQIERLWTERHEWRLMLRELYKLALEHNPDWTLLNGADEFIESPYRGLTLSEAIKIEASKGHILIQFDNFEFWPTEKDRNSRVRDVRKRITHYSWHDDDQFRCWMVYPGIIVDEFGSHKPSFPPEVEEKVSPNKFVLRHYKIRSYEHGLRKVFRERLPRYSPSELQSGWHAHYNNFTRDEHNFIIDSQQLTRYNDDGNWSLTKTFDGSFGSWNPPSNSEKTANLQRNIIELNEEIERLNEKIENSCALRLARKVPFGSHIRKLLGSRKTNTTR